MPVYSNLKKSIPKFLRYDCFDYQFYGFLAVLRQHNQISLLKNVDIFQDVYDLDEDKVCRTSLDNKFWHISTDNRDYVRSIKKHNEYWIQKYKSVMVENVYIGVMKASEYLNLTMKEANDCFCDIVNEENIKVENLL